jgi:hypothetical protein
MLTPLLGAALAAPLPSVDDRFPAGAAHPADAAVVVGNTDYAFLPDVPFADRDAEAMGDLLAAVGGIPADRIRRLRGANREQLMDAVRDATALLGPGGTLWVYFAGHGAASPSSAEALLVGDDAKRDAAVFTARSVSVPEIARIAGDHPLVLIVDACFSGAGRAGEVLVPGARFAVPVAFAAPAPHHVVATAASPDQVAGPFPAAEHGVFTWLVVGGLRGWADGSTDGRPDGAVTTGELSDFVARGLRTLQVSGQDPRWEGDRARVLVQGERLEPAPDLGRLRWDGGPVPGPVAAGGVVVHVGSGEFERDGRPFGAWETKGLAAQDPAGAVALQRMKTIPVAKGFSGFYGGALLVSTAVVLPMSFGAQEDPFQRDFYRTAGLTTLLLATPFLGWNAWLAHRTREQRNEIAAAATRVLAEGDGER